MGALPEYRHNADGSLDELVTPATQVHVEQLDDSHWWVGISLPDGGLLHVRLWTPRSRIRASYLEESEEGILEGGDFSARIVCQDEHPRVRRGKP